MLSPRKREAIRRRNRDGEPVREIERARGPGAICGEPAIWPPGG